MPDLPHSVCCSASSLQLSVRRLVDNPSYVRIESTLRFFIVLYRVVQFEPGLFRHELIWFARNRRRGSINVVSMEPRELKSDLSAASYNTESVCMSFTIGVEYGHSVRLFDLPALVHI